ncbi:CaiB/BaiF CoA transferase family protein [Rhodococcus spongiicola]|uniref:CoA transferase n=1 Tax=Rhodococcus spongiicola TaxID=2487352 RepID=A0A3S3AQP2_9NOCA|nr:CoA transferase [Rhodococcus spongiicola]RVW06140.1 CoA transferase [Rhodococcus spongiicola]
MTEHDPGGYLDPTKPQALEGITVVDFTRVLAGPTCTRMLADAGARIIKIERPGIGDDTRQMGPFADDGTSEYYRLANVGKESIAVDLKDPDDMALVRSMIKHADVVVENFRPGVMAGLGLAPDDLVAQHPRLIVCSISGFGQSGPMHQEPAYDTVVQALSGIMDATGWPDGRPTRVGTSISDIAGGIMGYCGVVTALVARERTGRGTTVDIAMLDSTFVLMQQCLMDVLGRRVRPTRLGNRHPFMYPFDTFECSDRPIAIAVGNDRLFETLCNAMGLTHLPADARFATNVNRCANHADLKAAMEKVLSTDTCETWRSRLVDAGVPVGMVLNIEDTCKLDQIAVRGMIKNVGGFDVTGTPLKFGTWDSVGATIPSPDLDDCGELLRREFAPRPDA